MRDQRDRGGSWWKWGWSFSLLLVLPVLAGCGGDGPLSVTIHTESPEPPEPELEQADLSDLSPGANASWLAATGRLSFRGTADFRCVPHQGTGLQISLRTGDPDLPVVALRIPDYAGTGTYQGRLFLTARGSGGGLLGSTGEVEVAVRQWDPPRPGERALLTARFSGRYGGDAGSGAVEGRVAPCAYAEALGAPVGTLASESGAEVSDLEGKSRSDGWNGPDGQRGGSR